MKLSDLHEMTMQAGSLEAPLRKAFEHISFNEKQKYSHVGDIEEIKVLRGNDIYFLTSEQHDIGFFQVINHGDTGLIQNMFVDTPFPKKGIMSKFFWFLKRNEGFDRIKLGDVHSLDTTQAIQKIAHRFNKVYWERGNKLTGVETRPFSPNTIDQFYGTTAPTGWSIVLENDGDFSNWPKFFNIVDVHTHYDWIFNTTD